LTARASHNGFAAEASGTARGGGILTVHGEPAAVTLKRSHDEKGSGSATVGAMQGHGGL
jgi:hypothetical protein